MKQNYVAAIDIGTTKIACLIANVSDEKNIELVGMGTAKSNGVWCGQVLNIEQTVKSIEEALLKAQAQAGVKISSVSVGIAGKNIRCTQNRGFINKESTDSEFTKADIDLLVRDQFKTMVNPGEEIIHVLPQDFIIDRAYPTDNPIGMIGKMLEANFHLVICKKDSINNIKKCIDRAQLETDNIILEPLASSDAVLNEDEKETGVILIDIGGGTTDIAIYNNKMIVHTAVIPFGGNVITNDIKSECGILERYAEELKKQYGEAVSDYTDSNKLVVVPGPKGREPKEISINLLANIIQSRMEEILDAVQHEINISGVSKRIGAGIVLTGGGSQLKNLQQLVAFKTGMDVRIGYPNEYIEANEIKDINNPMYSTAVGLLLKSVETFTTKEQPIAKEVQKPEAPKFEMPKAEMPNFEATPKPEPRIERQIPVFADIEDEFPTSPTKKKEAKPKKQRSDFFKSYILNLFDGEDKKFE